MRWLIRAIIVVVAVWALWWSVAGWVLTRQVSQALDEAGWRGSVSRDLNPLRIGVRMRDLAVDSAAAMMGLRVPAATLGAPVSWPGYLTLDLADRAVTLQTPVSDIVFEPREAEARLRIAPGTALDLRSLGAYIGRLATRIDDLALLDLTDLQLQAVRAENDAPVYALTLDAAEIAPAPRLREMLALPEDWPRTFDAFRVLADVTLDASLDRHVNPDAPPRPRRAVLRELDIAWGPLSLGGAGAIDIDAEGVPEGEVKLTVRNWKGWLDTAERSGLLPPASRAQVELFVAALAERSEDAATLDLDFVFAEGRMSLTGIDLGPAPRLGGIQRQ